MEKGVALETDLEVIAWQSENRIHEHEAFRNYLDTLPAAQIDTLVHELNDAITPAINCQLCGNCCRSLMINVTAPETHVVATHLQLSDDDFINKFVEVSQQGSMIINTIPCHFLQDNSCTIYPQRFLECREFPHLHKANFTSRLFGTLMHYGRCPIIYNVIEQLKETVQFKNPSE